MKIETKFNLGDSVFVLYHERVHEVFVTGVFASHELNCALKHFTSAINYRVRFEAGGEEKFSEDRLFATKEKLLESL